MPGVVLILGPDPFLAREAVRDVLARDPDLSVSRHEGKEPDLAAVLDDARTPAMFGGGRAVVVDQAAALLQGDPLEAIARYAAKPAPGSTLVLVAPGLDKRFKAAKALAELAEVVACKPPAREWEFAGWIADRAREAHGLQVGKEAAETLRLRIGEDLGLLDAALKRLAEQVAPRTRLSPQDITGSTEDHRSPALYEAANAFEARDPAGALRAVSAAFAEGVRIRQDVVTEAPGVGLILLGNLHGSVARLLRFHMARAAGSAEADAAREAGVSPNAVRFFLPNARLWKLPELLDAHRRFVEADLAMKGGGPDARRVLERLLLNLLG